MKKLGVIMLLFALIFTLCACKSNEAKRVDELILAIGEVSLDEKDKVYEAQEAYHALPDKDKNRIENYAILEEACETIFDETYEEIDYAFGRCMMKEAESLCQELLNNESMPLSEEQIAKLEKVQSDIKSVCFAGSYVVMPQYIIDMPIELDAPKIEAIQSGGLGGTVCAVCDVNSERELSIALKQYKEYVDSSFEYYDSQYYSTGAEEHLYDYIRLNTIPSGKYSSLQIWMSVGLFDLSEVDTSNPELTVADVADVVIWEE